MQKFRDRVHAGKVLAAELADLRGTPDLLVLGLPRGGVPVALEVARALDAPLDVFLVRKLGVPSHPELAMGAIASGGVRVLNDDVVEMLRIDPGMIEEVARQEQAELKRRQREYRGDRPEPKIEGSTVVLVDDGLATGSTMRAAAKAVRAAHPRSLVIAVPTGAQETCASLASEADRVICATTPEPFYAVGMWYQEFLQTTDDEVRECLALAERDHADQNTGSGGGAS